MEYINLGKIINTRGLKVNLNFYLLATLLVCYQKVVKFIFITKSLIFVRVSRSVIYSQWRLYLSTGFRNTRC